jgi:hypothetical protein
MFGEDEKRKYFIVLIINCLFSVDPRDSVLYRGHPRPIADDPPQAVVSLRPGEEHRL